PSGAPVSVGLVVRGDGKGNGGDGIGSGGESKAAWILFWILLWTLFWILLWILFRIREHKEEVPRKYVLPPRSNRGVPPKRYSPEKTTRGAKYLMATIAEGNMSNNAKAFALDVKNAILHGELKEEVYMEAPPGFSEHFKPGEACRLNKSLYGLKQSLRAWFGRFTLAMKRYGFKQSNSDHTLFLKNRKNRVTCLIIYIDDMVITGNDEEEIKTLKEGLFAEFEMKDQGNLKYFLGIEVLRSPKGIFICQKRKLIYLSHTRPNIGHAVGVVAHMNAALRIVRRSTSGYFSLVGGKLVTWRSKKQKVVSLSSAEAEFRDHVLNKAAIQISENPVQHDRTKHVEVDRHFIKEKLEAGIIELPFVKSSDQLADILIKAVGTDMFHKCLRKLNFGNPTIQLEGECWKRK
nr:putative RNA-directed DNA polymerase [Tanacetum cinerariifolium]